MKNVTDIRHFILTRYKREEINNAPLSARYEVEKLNMDKWDHVQEILFQQQIKQLSKKYPKCHIHVITNNPEIQNRSNLTVHMTDWESTHLCKLLAYGLLDEPAMYIDNDIIINRNFEKQHLPIHIPFNFYMKSNPWKIQDISKEKFPVPLDHHYNGGVIWIPKPSKAMRDEMIELNDRHFSDRERIMNYGRWADNDEFPAALYAAKHGIKMELSDQVSVQRQHIDIIRIYQSVHYTGLDIYMKRLCIKEYIRNNVKIY